MSDKDKNLAQRGITYMRKELAGEYPYMCSAIYALRLFEDEKEDSLSTDGRYLFYNPEYILKCYENNKMYKGLKYQYLHIMLHCLLGHVYKKNEDNELFYDVCADFAVDIALERLTGRGRKLTSVSEYSEKYKKLRSQAGRRSLEGMRNYCWTEEEQGSYLQRIGKNFCCDQHQYWLQKHPEVPDAGGGPNQRTQGTADMWKSLMLQTIHMESSLSRLKGSDKAAGSLAVSLEQEIHASEDNAASYKNLLQRMCSLREIIQTDDTIFDYIWYETGMELYGNIPFIEPAECVEELTVDDIVIAIDTSGSCSGEVASRFLRETCNLLRDMNIRGNNYQIRILQCDTEIQKEIIIHSKDDIPDFENQVLHGYGGTDFQPVFEHIERLRDKGEIQRVTGLIYLTDAEGDFPEKAPDYETVFIVINEYGDEGMNPYIPEWITTIMLTEDDIEELSE